MLNHITPSPVTVVIDSFWSLGNNQEPVKVITRLGVSSTASHSSDMVEKHRKRLWHLDFYKGPVPSITKRLEALARALFSLVSSSIQLFFAVTQFVKH